MKEPRTILWQQPIESLQSPVNTETQTKSRQSKWIPVLQKTGS
jgi:hypothetical protein